MAREKTYEEHLAEQQASADEERKKVTEGLKNLSDVLREMRKDS